jgi:type I restriction enzyme S subunit
VSALTPVGWQTARLDDVAKIISGSTPSRDCESYWGGSIAWASIKDMHGLDDGVVRQTAETISELGYKNCSTQLVPPGTVLFTSRAPIGLVAVAGIELCTNQGFKNFIPGHRIESRFLYHYLRRVAEKIDALGTGATFKEVSKATIGAYPIVFPPMEDQRRIADILDKSDAIRRKRREALALTDELLRATFLEMFGDPVTNPQGWPLAHMKDVLGIEAGWSANGEPRSARSHELGVLKVSAVTSGMFRAEENKALPVEDATGRELIIPKRGDLLFSRANTRELVAAVCLVDEDCVNVFLPDKLWRISPANGRATSEYLRYLLGHSRVHDLIAGTASGTSGSMLNVSQEKIRALRLPMPPVEQQRRFGAVVWKAYEARNAHLRGIAEADRLFASLQHRAFRGEL